MGNWKGRLFLFCFGWKDREKGIGMIGEQACLRGWRILGKRNLCRWGRGVCNLGAWRNYAPISSSSSVNSDELMSIGWCETHYIFRKCVYMRFFKMNSIRSYAFGFIIKHLHSQEKQKNNSNFTLYAFIITAVNGLSNKLLLHSIFDIHTGGQFKSKI